MFVNSFGDGACRGPVDRGQRLLHPGPPGAATASSPPFSCWPGSSANLGPMKEYGGVVENNLRVSWPDADKLRPGTRRRGRGQAGVRYAGKPQPELGPVRHEPHGPGPEGAAEPRTQGSLNAGTSRVQRRLARRPARCRRRAAVPGLGRGHRGRGPRRRGPGNPGPGRLPGRHENTVSRPGPNVPPAAWTPASMEAAKALGRALRPGSPWPRPSGRSCAAIRPRSSAMPWRAPASSAAANSCRSILPRLQSPSLADAAAAALLAYGERIAGTLGDALVDPDGDAAVRAALPACAGADRHAAGLGRPPARLRRRDADDPGRGHRGAGPGAGGPSRGRLCPGTLFPPRSANRSPRPAA